MTPTPEDHRRRPKPGWPSALGAAAAGVAAAVGCLAVGALAVIEGGRFDATAATPHAPAVAWAVHEAFIRSVRREAAAIAPPARFTAGQVAAGLGQYQHDCLACHGAPATPRARWVSGMNPTPPFLLDAARRWKPAELYWIISRGVKMTGMPAWGESRSEAQVWALVAFLEALPTLPPRDYLRLSEAEAKRVSEAGSPPAAGR